MPETRYLGILRPDPATCELTLTELHPAVELDVVRAKTGWPVAISPTPGPSAEELAVLRRLEAAGGANGSSSAT